MLILEVQSSLLDGLQTFVGVVITLIVLCIRDTSNSGAEDISSNYIRTIIGYIRIDRMQYFSELTSRLQLRIKRTSKDFDEIFEKALPSKKKDLTAIKDEMEKLRTEAENWIIDPTSEYNMKLNNYFELSNNFYNKNYDSLTALFILCISMVVMLFDCIGLSNFFTYPFVITLTFFVIIYSVNIWYAFYYSFGNKSTISSNGFDLKEHSRWIVYDGIIVSLFIFSFCVWTMSFWNVIMTALLFIGLEFLLHRYVFTFSCITDKNYTKTELLIHVFHFVTVSIIAGIMSYLITSSLVYNNGPFDVHTKQVFDSNMLVLRNINFNPAYLFAVIIALDAFFLPIIISFVFCKRKAVPVKRVYEQKEKEIQKEMDTLIQHYNQIKKQI